jgi:hypothetical protein
MRIASIIDVSLAAISAAIAIAANAQMSGGSSRVVSKTDPMADAGGNLHVPDSYRSSYEFLGSWAVAADQGQGAGLCRRLSSAEKIGIGRALEVNKPRQSEERINE